MTDQTIPADRARKLAARFRQQMEPHTPAAECEVWERAAEAVEALLPAPPTLADMTREERAACRWMQCDAGPLGRRGVITNAEDWHVYVVDKETGLHSNHSPDMVTPRPDLPRLEWPGTEKPVPAPALPDGWRLADHEENGRGIVTNLTPNRDGRVYFVIPADDPMGYDWIFCTPDELTYLEQGADTSDTVPESTLSVGSVWKNANALTRACSESGRDQIAVIDKNGDVGVWDAELRGWRAYTPGPVFAPYTIIHTGREDDQ